MTRTYSAYQQAIFDFIANDTASAIVDAKAGSGKTTTIVEACSRIPEEKTVLFLAFNKAIVEELKLRLPSGTACATYNAIGYRAWRNFINSSFLKVDGSKVRKFVRDRFSEKNYDLYGAFVPRMVSLAKGSGLVPLDSVDAWMELAEHHALSLDAEGADIAQAIALAQRTLVWSIDESRKLIDFDDQIYMPWLHDAAFERFDFVFIDEAQDTNVIQKELLKRMIKPEGRLIAVGDPHQAIYGFRGADADSMANIAEAFNAKTLPLSISYRCSPAVIQEAQKYVPSILPNPERPFEGTVETLENYTAETFTYADAILCRNNAPLIKMAYSLIKRGKGVNFAGRDLGVGLTLLIRKMKAASILDLTTKLANYYSAQCAIYRAKDQEERIGPLEDKINCINVVIENLSDLPNATIGDLINSIENLFESTQGRGVTLSSVHKSKGREWPNVYILDFVLMPSRFARKPWQRDQEQNLIYVAITRAQQNLYYIDSGCFLD